ncbi:TlpA family protein disulfide reductase [Lysinibacillus sp. LZ02]|uniref:TlpA family protein disulfide reductase n=1 Tax=Lysinibacillus sp. LZ02 TaxID=3420668 RepID=UPI003D35C816
MKLRAPMPSLDGAKWLNGRGWTNDMLTGKPTFIHFWSVSCNLCKHGLDTINHLADQYMGDLNIIAVHMPRTEEDVIVDNVKKVIKYYDMLQPIVIDNEFLITDRFNNRYVPSYYLFDDKGLLRHYQAGGSGLRILEKRIERVVQEHKGMV